MTALVTCIYNNLHGTAFGGRNRQDRYTRSLKVICQTGARVFCFTSNNDLPLLREEFSGIDNIQFLVMELDSLPFHSRVQEIKQSIDTSGDVFYLMRSFEVMWGKMVMLREVIEAHPELDDVYWIDAGLSHRDVISSKYCREEDIERDHTELTFGVFTPRLIRALKEFLTGQLLVIGSPYPNNAPIPVKYNTLPYADNIGLVGGLFGGCREKMLEVIVEFDGKVEAILKNGELYSEEGILTAVYADRPELFKRVTFDTWYHEGWGDWHDPNLKNFSNIFDDLLEMDTLEHKAVVTTMAFGDQYREESIKFINTFLEKTTGLELAVLSDNIDYYASVTDPRVSFYSIEILRLDPFPYNVKARVIEKCHSLFPNYDTIVYFDCDCFWVAPVKAEDLLGLPAGLNVADNVVGIERLTNPAIRRTVDTLREEGETEFHEFREAGLIFKIDNKYQFQRFLYEWKLMYDRIEAEGLAHNGECWILGMISTRSGYPIHRIDMDRYSAITKAVMTTTLGDVVPAIL